MNALLLIDIQNGLTKNKTLYNEEFFFDSVNNAIKFFRESGSKIIFAQHNNNQLKNGTFDWQIDSRIDKQDNDIVVQKKHGNAFQKTDLKTILLDIDVKSITIGGLVSHGCVKASCLGGSKEGFETLLLKNGHTNWNKNAETLISDTETELFKSGIYSDVISNKPLHELTTEEFGKLFPIIIQDYNNKWPELFEAEKDLINNSFIQSDIIRIDHIGSTSIPGLKAKPTIDILIQISEQIDLKKLESVFLSLNYHLNKQPDNPPPHMTFVKGYTQHGFRGQAYHVHVRYKGNWEEIRFRDYLITHKEVAIEYETLKLKLADMHKNNREEYTNSKTDFIQSRNKITQINSDDSIE